MKPATLPDFINLWLWHTTTLLLGHMATSIILFLNANTKGISHQFVTCLWTPLKCSRMYSILRFSSTLQEWASAKQWIPTQFISSIWRSIKRQQASRTAITSKRLAAARRACDTFNVGSCMLYKQQEEDNEMPYLHIRFGDVHLWCVGVAHKHAYHLRLDSIDGNSLLFRFDQISGKHSLGSTNHQTSHYSSTHKQSPCANTRFTWK